MAETKESIDYTESLFTDNRHRSRPVAGARSGRRAQRGRHRQGGAAARPAAPRGVREVEGWEWEWEWE